MIKEIKINDPQPVPCPHCGGIHGYKYYDLIRMHYMSEHNADGSYWGGEYTSGKPINRGKTAFCSNCDEKLPFKLIRNDKEIVNNTD